MILPLSAAVSIKTRFIEKRGNVFQFVMRVPSDLIEKFGKDRIRESLKTTDPQEAIRKADQLAKRYLLQFKVLRGKEPLTPLVVSEAAAALADKWGSLDAFVDSVVEPKRDLYAQGDDEIHQTADPAEYLTPVEIAVVNRFKEGTDAVRLSTALDIYWKTHKKSGDSAFVAKVSRDWNKLVSLVGDVTVLSLNRAQARHFVDHCLEASLKTTSVRRSISHINAVLNVAIREAELTKQNPFANLPIAGEGSDSEETKVPSTAELKEIIATFRGKMSSATSLMILLPSRTWD